MASLLDLGKKLKDTLWSATPFGQTYNAVQTAVPKFQQAIQGFGEKNTRAAGVMLKAEPAYNAIQGAIRSIPAAPFQVSLPQIQKAGTQFAQNANQFIQGGINKGYSQAPIQVPFVVKPFTVLPEMGRAFAQNTLTDWNLGLTTGRPETNRLYELTTKRRNSQEEKEFRQLAANEGLQLATGMVGGGKQLNTQKSLSKAYQEFSHNLGAVIKQAGRKFTQEELDNAINVLAKAPIDQAPDVYHRNASAIARYIQGVKSGLLVNKPGGVGLQAKPMRSVEEAERLKNTQNQTKFVPSKTEKNLGMEGGATPLPLSQNKGVVGQPTGLNVFNAEPKPEKVAKIQESQAQRDFKDWSSMIFKKEGAKFKTKEEQLIHTIGNSIETATNKGIENKARVAKRELSAAQTEARKAFVTNEKGKVITSKGGSPIDKDVLLRAQDWNDKPRLSYARETMTRNFEDIMGKDAPEMKARYLEPVQKAEASRIRWLNKEREQIKSLGITPRSEESKLVQLLGEKQITPQQLKGNKNAERIIKAESVLRAKYKTYLSEINGVLKRNGYDPIPERKDYFRHFTEVQGMLEQFGIPIRDSALPTDINGLSSDFKPGKNFFSSALQRKTDITDYDAIQGIDRYIDGASKQIFHTDNIQNLRLLDKAIRETFAGTKHLTNFVADLTEYTNALAGKKAMIDRSVESALGRGIYAATDALRRRTGANMVGANIASAATNYIPLTQALATTDKPSFAKGMMQTIASVFKDDGFINRSDFLTRRVGSDPLSTTAWQNAANKSMWLFQTIDKFVSGTIVRGKYNEAIAKGLSPSQAMKQADEWAAKIMADRSAGSMPTMFNSKTLGLLTQFQLEVNNQMSLMFKDIPRSYNTIGAASALGQVFLYGYLFNNLFEKAFGRRPAFDPIGVSLQAYEDYTNPNLKKGQATKNLIGNVSDSLPFVSIATGGRIPIGGALPNPIAVASGESNWNKELKKPLYYLAPPFGGGQLKKTIEGIGAYMKGGSVTDSGRVRYPIPQTTANAVRTAIGGQYSTPEARKYFREGTTALGEKQSEGFRNAQDKERFYQDIIEQRGVNRAIEQAKLDVKQSKQDKTIGNTLIYWDEKTDTARTKTIKPSTKTPKKSSGLSKGKSAKKISIKKITPKTIRVSLPKSKKPATIKMSSPPKPKQSGKVRKTAVFKIKPIKTKKLIGLTAGKKLV